MIPGRWLNSPSFAVRHHRLGDLKGGAHDPHQAGLEGGDERLHGVLTPSLVDEEVMQQVPQLLLFQVSQPLTPWLLPGEVRFRESAALSVTIVVQIVLHG